MFLLNSEIDAAISASITWMPNLGNYKQLLVIGCLLSFPAKLINWLYYLKSQCDINGESLASAIDGDATKQQTVFNQSFEDSLFDLLSDVKLF